MCSEVCFASDEDFRFNVPQSGDFSNPIPPFVRNLVLFFGHATSPAMWPKLPDIGMDLATTALVLVKSRTDALECSVRLLLLTRAPHYAQQKHPSLRLSSFWVMQEFQAWEAAGQICLRLTDSQILLPLPKPRACLQVLKPLSRTAGHIIQDGILRVAGDFRRWQTARNKTFDCSSRTPTTSCCMRAHSLRSSGSCELMRGVLAEMDEFPVLWHCSLGSDPDVRHQLVCVFLTLELRNLIPEHVTRRHPVGQVMCVVTLCTRSA